MITQVQSAFKTKVEQASSSNVKLDTIIFVNLVFLLTIFKLQLFGVETVEYKNTFQYWYEFLKEKGFTALKETYYNKTPTFISLIFLGTLLNLPSIISLKVISIIFDFVLAWATSSVYKQIKGEGVMAKLVFLTTFGLPGLIINSSLWGNLDVIWTSLSMVSVLFLLKKKYTISSIFLALAFCFDLKALFFFPLFVVLFFKKEITKKAFLFYSFFPPILFFLSLIPSIVLGRPLVSNKINGANVEGLLNIYFHQNQFSNQIVSGATPNVYSWIASDLKGLLIVPITILLVSLVGVLTFLLSHKSKYDYSKINVLEDLLLINTFFVFFAPNMTQQSFFFSELMALLLLFLKPSNWLLYLVIIISSTIGQWKSVIDTIQIPFFLEFYWSAVFIFIVIYKLIEQRYKSTDLQHYEIS
ncbi:MAG: hypothetical protein ACRCXZ_00030 [Patescibacteria group bacterium]